MAQVTVNIEIYSNISGNIYRGITDIRKELGDSSHWPITCHLGTCCRLKAMWNLTEREIKEGRKRRLQIQRKPRENQNEQRR